MKTKENFSGTKTLICFITCTSLAGAPIRIADALNKYTDFEVRVINLNPNCYGSRTFPEDLIWNKNKEECIDLISNADILHFHHYFNIESENNPFGINFEKLAPRAKKIRHFHSDYNFIFGINAPSDIMKNDKYPHLVIPHCAERTFLHAYIVPNIIPVSELPLENINNQVCSVFYSATSNTSMWDIRWNTKGLPEVKAKMKHLKRKVNFNFQIIQNILFEECQNLKRKSNIVIGDTTTGSYHLTDLEALALGKPTFSYLDSRSQFVLQNLLKCDDLPFVNTRLEEIDLPFIELVKNKTLREEIGQFSRNWIEKYYNDKNLVSHFVDVYNKLLNGEPIKRQNSLIYSEAKKFLYNDLYDMQWEQRKKRNKKFMTKKEFKIFIQKIFSVKNSDNHKVVTILGIKIKFEKLNNTLNKKEKCKIIFEIEIGAGIGDILIDLNYLYYLKNIINLSNAEITLFINRNNTELLRTFLGDNCDFVSKFYSREDYKNDTEIYDLTIYISAAFPIFTIHNKRSLKYKQKELYKMATENKAFRKRNKEYFGNFFNCIPLINKYLLKQNKKRIQLPDFNNKLGIKKDFIIPIPVRNENQILEKYNLKDCRYITVNRGINPDIKGNYSTKLWSLRKYSELCRLLKEKYPDITLVQTGVSKEKCGVIDYIDTNLLGQTDLYEMTVILKNSVLHIDGEGGMVHLKNALKGKSVVLFGPTDPDIYGYSENINIRNYSYCQTGCDWEDPDWMLKCIKSGDKAKCMDLITPDNVFEKICSQLDIIIRKNEIYDKCM